MWPVGDAQDPLLNCNQVACTCLCENFVAGVVKAHRQPVVVKYVQSELYSKLKLKNHADQATGTRGPLTHYKPSSRHTFTARRKDWASKMPDVGDCQLGHIGSIVLNNMNNLTPFIAFIADDRALDCIIVGSEVQHERMTVLCVTCNAKKGTRHRRNRAEVA